MFHRRRPWPRACPGGQVSSMRSKVRHTSTRMVRSGTLGYRTATSRGRTTMDEAPGLEKEAPPTLSMLGTVLQAQAAIYVLSALIGSISYFVRGPGTLKLGTYAN